MKKEKYISGKLVKDRNEPCMLLQVLEVTAKIRHVEMIDLAEQVYRNTKRLFPTIFGFDEEVETIEVSST
jgi:TatD DNase family protein